MNLQEIKIINFSSMGGIEQFSSYISKRCFSEDTEILNSNNLYEVYSFIKKNRYSTFLFMDNSMKIYLMFYLFRIDAILILHDHKLRKGASFREKVLNFFIYKNINRFKKVIIHENNQKLLHKYSNMVFLKMPYFNEKIIDDSNKINLLFFGRIEKYKNIDMLIDSTIDIPDKFNLIIAGSGLLSDENISTINSSSNITLINQFIDDRTRDILIEWCHYFILPYNSLTQTGIINMAGSYNKPSIISNIDGFKDYIGVEYKNVVDIRDKEKFINSLNNIYIDYNTNYDKAVLESYTFYLNSLENLENYKKYLKGLI